MVRTAQEEIVAGGEVWGLAVSRVGAGHTYRFQPLHRLLADVHAPGFLHLHVTKVLQTDTRELSP